MAARLQDKVPRLEAVNFNNAATDGTVTSVLLPKASPAWRACCSPTPTRCSNSESERQLIERMVQLTDRVADQEDLVNGAAALGLSPYQVLIVASIIDTRHTWTRTVRRSPA